MRDTSALIEKIYHQKIMERSPEERFIMGIRMFETARSIVLSSLPEDMPPGERFFNLFLRFYGHEFDHSARQQIKRRMLDAD